MLYFFDMFDKNALNVLLYPARNIEKNKQNILYVFSFLGIMPKCLVKRLQSF